MTTDSVIIAGAGILALLWWRNRPVQAEGAVSVTGATVTVENVEAIEERVGWVYSGLDGELRPTDWPHLMNSGFVAFRLHPGTWYSQKPAMPGMGKVDFFRWVPGYTPNKGGVPVAGEFYHYTPEPSEWNASWRREVLTVGQQLASGAIIPVPIAYLP